MRNTYPIDFGKVETLLSSRMGNVKAALLADQRLDYGLTKVKSYFLEAHPARSAKFDSNLPFVDFLSSSIDFLQAYATNDDNLFVLQRQREDSQDRTLEYYLDARDDRYWIVHTLDESVNSDHFISKLIAAHPYFDRFWIPSTLLKEWADSTVTTDKEVTRRMEVSSEALTDWGLQYNGELSGTQRKFKVSLEADGDDKIFDLFNSPLLKGSRTLHKKTHVIDSGEVYTSSDVYSYGKVTNHGGIAGHYLSYLKSIKERYKSRVTDIEDNYSFGFRKPIGKFQGEPLTIELDSVSIEDIEIFANKISDPQSDFRLFGIPESRPGYALIRAVDLHIGQSIDIEVTPNAIRLILLDGTCGNSVLRFITNIQRFVDSDAKVYDLNRRVVI